MALVKGTDAYCYQGFDNKEKKKPEFWYLMADNLKFLLLFFPVYLTFRKETENWMCLLLMFVENSNHTISCPLEDSHARPNLFYPY